MRARDSPRNRSFRVLKEAESGLKVSDLCRRQGISEATYSGGSPSTVGWRSQRPSG